LSFLASLPGTLTPSPASISPGKPYPDVYLTAVEKLGLAPAVCAAVEDSSNGLRSAAAAGLAVVAVPHGVYPPAPDAIAGASLIVSDLGRLTVEAIDRLR